MNVRPQTIKLIEENVDSQCFDITRTNNFLDVSPLQEEEAKEKIDKQDYIKVKSFCTVKET